jgi:acetylcholinesterase
MGGTPDRRYNLSFIVENSVHIGKPIIGVSIAYRLGPWGFLYSAQVQGSGNSNMGLRETSASPFTGSKKTSQHSVATRPS